MTAREPGAMVLSSKSWPQRRGQPASVSPDKSMNGMDHSWSLDSRRDGRRLTEVSGGHAKDIEDRRVIEYCRQTAPCPCHDAAGPFEAIARQTFCLTILKDREVNRRYSGHVGEVHSVAVSWDGELSCPAVPDGFRWLRLPSTKIDDPADYGERA